MSDRRATHPIVEVARGDGRAAIEALGGVDLGAGRLRRRAITPDAVGVPGGRQAGGLAGQGRGDDPAQRIIRPARRLPVDREPTGLH